MLMVQRFKKMLRASMFFYTKNVTMQFLYYKIILPSNYKQTFEIDCTV